MAFTRITVVQDYSLADGTEPSGTVTFTPSVPMANGGVVVPTTASSARLNGAGTITITLDANTDPGTTPPGASYRVLEEINGHRNAFTVRIPHDQGAALTLYDWVVT